MNSRAIPLLADLHKLTAKTRNVDLHPGNRANGTEQLPMPENLLPLTTVEKAMQVAWLESCGGSLPL